jgi:hypothetical protein
MVLTLHQAALVVPSRYVLEPNVVRYGGKERNAVTNEHWYASDNEPIDQPRTQKPLNRYSTVNVEVVGTTGSELRNDLTRSPCHLFNNTSTGCGQINGATAQNHHAFVTVWPSPKCQNLFEGVTTYYKGVDACDELAVAMRFAAAFWQKIEITVRPGNEAVDAGANKNRDCHRSFLTRCRLTQIRMRTKPFSDSLNETGIAGEPQSTCLKQRKFEEHGQLRQRTSF